MPRTDAAMDRALRELAEAGSSCVSGLTPPAAACFAARLAAVSPLLVICPDDDSAEACRVDLTFFLGGGDVMLLAPPENRPYEGLAPDRYAAAQRIRALYGLADGEGPVVTTASALLYPVPGPRLLQEWRLVLAAGGYIHREETIRRLGELGYRRVPVTVEPGTFAVRGGIIDLYSPGMDNPVRLELWEEEVRSIRTFDPESQRSLAPTEKAVVYPVSEMPLTGKKRGVIRDKLQELLLAAAVPAAERAEVLDRWDERLPLPGEPLYLPLLSSPGHFPLDLASSSTVMLVMEPEDSYRAMGETVAEAGRRADPRFPAPADLLAPVDQVRRRIGDGRHVLAGEIQREGCIRVRCEPPLTLDAASHRTRRLQELSKLIERGRTRTVLSARSDAAAQRLLSLLGPTGDKVARCRTFSDALSRGGVCIVAGALSGGFSLPDEDLTVVGDTDLFGRARPTRRPPGAVPEWDLPIGSLEEGDIVVHIEHGIGRYQGLRQLDIADSTDDFLHIVFAGDDSLYVPIWEMNRVQRYRSSSDTPPPLSRLGSAVWKRTKTRIRRSLQVMAGELLKLSAAREHSPGHPFRPPDTLFSEFEASFRWQETTDQEQSIHSVIEDMTAPRPMDRLVCGDVGFGKTEVAMRAAFLAAADGKQTAVLVPTTVLAQQHYQTFSERFADFPVTTGLLSRFVPAAAQQKTLAGVEKGEIDILIGTHRLLSGDVMFHDLGLLVIDEEHRFGVKHKEALKRLKETVDVLTLSATPIPRTLFQAFSGLRSLSLIHTPPADRKSVHTEVRYFDEMLLREAISREIDRGGQVFVVHNRVQTIGAFADLLGNLCPEARISVAHGQMAEGDLEKIMLAFTAGESDVLVATAIIESGLDITNANTLIINRADRFGLAQLYQLRGRVGRSSVLGYAYLLIPAESRVTRQARQRLRRLRELTELGSGFKLASFDLEMRGAGNLLGAEQSGRIDSVGIDLYSQLLEQAVKAVAGQEPAVEVEPAITLAVPAFLPEDYLPDVSERLTLYKRIASLRDEAAMETLRDEVVDRFGRLPGPVAGLFTRTEITILARKLGVERIDTAGPFIMAAFHPEARISPDVLVRLLGSDNRLTFLPPATLRLDVSSLANAADKVAFMREILTSLC